MTRLGPLTSQALGRSPYDIVAQGEGEADPRAPAQSYDERGRPVNMATKRINRDIVRSHNEVMQVIGVAEPDSGTLVTVSEDTKRLQQQQYEDQLGRRLWVPTRLVGFVGIWGAEPLRQRVLLFRRYSAYPPWKNFRHDYGARPLFEVLTLGLPIYFLGRWLRYSVRSRESIRSNVWKRAAVDFWALHLHAYLLLQRLKIVPMVPMLPSVLFFVPFSSQSPISLPPPLPTTLTAHSLSQWTAQSLLNVAPLACLYGFLKLRSYVWYVIDYAIFDLQAVPSNPPLVRPVSEVDPYQGDYRAAGMPPVDILHQQIRSPGLMPRLHHRSRPPPPPPPPPPATDSYEQPNSVEDSRRNAMDGNTAELVVDASVSMAGPWPDTEDAQQQQTPQQRTGTSRPESPPSVRRRNTVSSRGGDDGYISEEEEFELSATLISFDVEATEAGDTPSNAWSAELRQSPSNGGYDADSTGVFGSQFSHGSYIRGVYYPGHTGPFFSDTMLSRLPAAVFSASVAPVLTSLGLADVEALVLRLLARTYRIRNMQPVGDLYPLTLLPLFSGGFSWNAANHLAVVVLLEAAIETLSVLAALGMGYLYHGSEQGWSFFRVVKEKVWRRRQKRGKRTSRAA